MNNSIFENIKTDIKFTALAKKVAKLEEKKKTVSQEFMSETSPETLRDIFKTIEENGHPYEQEAIHQLRTKYENNKSLDFNDILALRNFYKSICNTLKNKDDDNG